MSVYKKTVRLSRNGNNTLVLCKHIYILKCVYYNYYKCTDEEETKKKNDRFAMYLLMLKYYMYRVYLRQKSARRKTGEKRPLEGCAPLCMCVCICMCVRVCAFVCVYVRVCACFARLEDITIIIVVVVIRVGGVYGGGEQSLPKRHISLLCAPGTTLGDFLTKTHGVERKKNRYYIHRFLARTTLFFPTSPQRHHLVGVARRPSLFLMRVYFFFSFCFLAFVFCPRTGFLSSVILYSPTSVAVHNNVYMTAPVILYVCLYARRGCLFRGIYAV